MQKNALCTGDHYSESEDDPDDINIPAATHSMTLQRHWHPCQTAASTDASTSQLLQCSLHGSAVSLQCLGRGLETKLLVEAAESSLWDFIPASFLARSRAVAPAFCESLHECRRLHRSTQTTSPAVRTSSRIGVISEMRSAIPNMSITAAHVSSLL